MPNSPPVSVCLLTYNRAALLPATLDSLLSQTYGDFELVLSDDASTDETEQVCQAYARQDARIRYLRNPANLGMPGNLNAALQAAGGEYLANLHDGDVYHPDLLRCWKGVLDRNPTAGFVFNAYRQETARGQAKIYREDYAERVPGRALAGRLLMRWDSCVFGTVMARRQAYQTLGLFDPQFGNFSDVDMWLRMASRYDVGYANEVLMDLMPRDPTRFYASVHWKVWFWTLGIHTRNLERCQALLPELTQALARVYPSRRNRLFLEYMLTALRQAKGPRAREGFAICRDADDGLLQKVGRAFGRDRDKPDWYTPAWWQMARRPMLKAAR